MVRSFVRYFLFLFLFALKLFSAASDEPINHHSRKFSEKKPVVKSLHLPPAHFLIVSYILALNVHKSSPGCAADFDVLLGFVPPRDSLLVPLPKNSDRDLR